MAYTSFLFLKKEWNRTWSTSIVNKPDMYTGCTCKENGHILSTQYITQA